MLHAYTGSMFLSELQGQVAMIHIRPTAHFGVSFDGAVLFGVWLLLSTTSGVAADRMAPPRLAGGGAPPGVEAHDVMPPFVRANIEHQLWQNAQRLQARGQLPASTSQPRIDGLIWPMRARAGYRDFDYHGVSNYVDLNPAFPDQLLDWTCGTRTYDLESGYNHAGVDYFLWPFSWRMMDAEMIEIVAAAPGTILHKQDGFDDRSCTDHYSADWNAVYVQHGDGSVAWYGHMKLGSLTAKPVGASVAAGEFLGLVASSGLSSGPHLHFELRESNLPGTQILEAHNGACRAGPTLWAVQRPYRDSGINKLATHSAPPSFNVACPDPGQETPNFSDNFQPGVDTLILAAYFRDQTQGSTTTYRLKRRGQVQSQWNHASPETYSAAYWYWSHEPLAPSAPHGVWLFEAEYAGRIYRHEFTVGDVLFGTSFGG